MDANLKKRVDQAWENCRDWITQFDGDPNLALLLDFPEENLLPSLAALSGQSESLRVTAILSSQSDAPQFIPLDEFPAAWEQLRSEQVEDLSANYAFRSEPFDLDIHMVFYPMEPQRAAVELAWWSDQVFSDETDNHAQFGALLTYFIGLQSLFSATYLFVSPDTAGGPQADSWIEV